MNDRIAQFININVTGRVFMLCNAEGVKNAAEVRQYEKQVRDVLEGSVTSTTTVSEIEQLLGQELDALRRRIRQESLKPEMPDLPEEASFFDDEAEVTQDLSMIENLLDSLGREEGDVEPDDAKRPARKRKSGGNYAPEATSMEEKLQEQRKPIEELLTKDCVSMRLLTLKRANYWIQQMSGRNRQDAEEKIVSELKDNLQEQVKVYIRKNKDHNPWSTPRLQEDLRADVAMVRTVRGIVTLSTQIRREIRNFKGGKPSIMRRLFKRS